MVYDHASRDSTPGAPRARSTLPTTTTRARDDATRIAREASTGDDDDDDDDAGPSDRDGRRR